MWAWVGCWVGFMLEQVLGSLPVRGVTQYAKQSNSERAFLQLKT